MCGRYALALSNEEVYDALQNQLPQIFQGGVGGGGGGSVGRPRWERQQDYRPNYNIAPRQRAPVIHRYLDSGEPIIETMQWGLIPRWTKHPPTGPLNTINARSEALIDASSGGMWHSLKGHKRCIVPAQGYYEWHKRPSAKIAHFTRLPLTPTHHDNLHPPLMFLAGLYDHVKYLSPVESRFKPTDGDDSREAYPTGNPIPLATYTILTTIPANDIAWLHDRMPCVLKTWEEIRRWLDLGEVKGWEEGKGGTAELLKGTPGLDCFPVPPEVGKIGTNSPTYIQPVSERSDGIKSFFQKKQQPSPAKKSPAPPSTPGKSVSTSPSKMSSKTPKAVKREEDDGAETKVEGKEEEGLGDDSNAPIPNPPDQKPSKVGGVKTTVSLEDEEPAKAEIQDKLETSTSGTPSKRKRGSGGDGDDRKGGHQTKVVRRTNSDDNKAQPAITSFFKSPEKKTRQVPTTRGKKRKQ